MMSERDAHLSDDIVRHPHLSDDFVAVVLTHLSDDVVEAAEVLRLRLLHAVRCGRAPPVAHVPLQRLDEQQVALDGLQLAQVGEVGVEVDGVGNAVVREGLAAQHRTHHLRKRARAHVTHAHDVTSPETSHALRTGAGV